MNTIQRVTKNVSILFISQMLSYVLGFVTLAYTARYLGVGEFGTLSFALAFTGIFSVIMDLGLSTLTIREVARDKSITKDYVANITAIKILLALFTFGLIFLIINILGYNPQTILVVYFITIFTIFNTFSLLFYAIFQANEKMEYQSLGAILSSVLLLAGILIAIHLKFDIVQFSFIYTITGAGVLVYAVSSFSIKFSFPN